MVNIYIYIYNMNSKNILYILTFFIDLFLIYTVLILSCNILDKLFILSVLICHAFFFFALKNENKTILDICHLLVFILPFLALFLENKYIKSISIFLLIVIQTLWYIKNKCILNDFTKGFVGIGDKIEIEKIVLILTLILIYQLIT